MASWLWVIAAAVNVAVAILNVRLARAARRRAKEAEARVAEAERKMRQVQLRRDLEVEGTGIIHAYRDAAGQRNRQAAKAAKGKGTRP